MAVLFVQKDLDPLCCDMHKDPLVRNSVCLWLQSNTM